MRDRDQHIVDHFGAWLRRARQDAGLSQAQLAEKIDTSTETIARYERGEREPGIATAVHCAAALGVRPHAWVDALVGSRPAPVTVELAMVGRTELDHIARHDPANLPAAVAALQGIGRLSR